MGACREMEHNRISEREGYEEAVFDAPPTIMQVERRIHVRAYNRWLALRHGRPLPSARDMDSPTLAEFAPRAVKLRYNEEGGDPELLFVGRALRDQAGIEADAEIDQTALPEGTLLQRLVARHNDMANHRSPVAVEAEYVGEFGEATLYRGVMLPFSSDGRTIDHLYGIVNWKLLAPGDVPADISDAVEAARSGPMEPRKKAANPFPQASDEDCRKRLREHPGVAAIDIDPLPFESEFVMLVGRRQPDGTIALVAALPPDAQTLRRATDALLR